MKIFEKIKINIKDGKSYQYRLFGIPIFQYDKFKDSKITLKNLIHFSPKIKNNEPVFYLKVNRNEDYTFSCLQHWINTVEMMGADYYILCDKPKLERSILKRIVFPNSNIKFLKSCRDNNLKKYVDKIATKFWAKAAYAHLTTFLHAKNNGFQSFWNVDADDTTFTVMPEKCIQILKKAENYAKDNKIDAFSFDMWNSRTKNVHWSFGITYTQMNKDWFDIFDKNIKIDWKTKYSSYATEWNADFFFTHLRDTGEATIQQFYVDNLIFIHWGSFMINIIGSNICQFKNGKIIYPIISKILKNKDVGEIPIAKESIKFDLNITEDECINFILNYVTILNLFSEKTQKLWCIETICQNLDRSY